MASETVQSGAGQGFLPISLSFRAARIVAATRIVYFRSSIDSSSGNGCGNHGSAKEQIDRVPILGVSEKRKEIRKTYNSRQPFRESHKDALRVRKPFGIGLRGTGNLRSGRGELREIRLRKKSAMNQSGIDPNAGTEKNRIARVNAF